MHIPGKIMSEPLFYLRLPGNTAKSDFMCPSDMEFVSTAHLTGKGLTCETWAKYFRKESSAENYTGHALVGGDSTSEFVYNLFIMREFYLRRTAE